MDRSVEALLEDAERDAKAKAKQAAKARHGPGSTVDASRDPRIRKAMSPDDDDSPPRPVPKLARTKEDMEGSSSNANRYSIERQENDQRRSRRSRDLDDERRNSDDQGSANGSVRSRRRSRSPARSRRDSRDRGDIRTREYRERDGRDRPAAGDYYNGGGRPPPYDDDRYRPGRDEPRRDRSPRRGDRDRPRGGGRERPRSPPDRRRKSPEPTDDERDRRTVFVQQLAARLRTKELKTFFEQVGPVVEAQIVKDRISQRSKGYIYQT